MCLDDRRIPPSFLLPLPIPSPSYSCLNVSPVHRGHFCHFPASCLVIRLEISDEEVLDFVLFHLLGSLTRCFSVQYLLGVASPLSFIREERGCCKGGFHSSLYNYFNLPLKSSFLKSWHKNHNLITCEVVLKHIGLWISRVTQNPKSD